MKHDTERVIESLTRPAGEWFGPGAPEAMQDYFEELEKFVLQPLIARGLSLSQAIAVFQCERLQTLTTQLRELLQREFGDDDDDS